jgi:RTX calcium-binding nonapeptide repeat (4 copies)
VVGGAGNDEISGDSNDNKLDGGAGFNTAVFRGVQSDYTITSLADGSRQVADSVAGRDGTDTLTNIEQLRFSDGDIIYGTPGADTLQGTAGNDTLIGGGGGDMLSGGSGKDTFVFADADNSGTDIITDFEVGTDVRAILPRCTTPLSPDDVCDFFLLADSSLNPYSRFGLFLFPTDSGAAYRRATVSNHRETKGVAPSHQYHVPLRCSGGQWLPPRPAK